jgi:hypothetical protein
MTSPLRAIILAALLAIATPSVTFAADELPKFDTSKSCKAAFSAYTGADKAGYETCLKEETAAGAQIGSTWAQWPPRDRAHCAQLAALGGTPSYIEMLTCLQIARDTKTLPTDIKKSGLPKQ